MSVEYRAGLPTIEQVEAHEKRTKFAQWMRRSRPNEDCPVHGGPGFTSLESRFWRYILSSGIDFNALEYRPASDDGDPMPWPGEPSEGIDSLRKALSISDEIARDYRKEVERLTIDRDLHKAYAVESQRRFDEARAEVAHLREGIAVYHKDYLFVCGEMGDTANRSVEDWRERDRNRAEGRQLEIPALCQACNPEWSEYRCPAIIDDPSGEVAPKGTRCTRERNHPGVHQAGPALWREAKQQTEGSNA